MKTDFSSPVATAESSKFADIEYSTWTASYFRIWKSLAGISAPPLALLVVMFPKTYFTPHSRMSGCRWVTTPSWLSQSLRPFLHSYCCYCSVSRVQLFVTAWTAACQASLSFTVSRSMLRFTSFALLIPPNHLIPCYPFSFISIMPCISVDTRYRYVFIFTQSFAWALQEQKDENLCGPSYMGCSLLSHLSQSLSFLWLFFCSWPKYQDQGFYPWRRKWKPTPLQCSCLENSMDRGAWCVKSMGCKEPDMTELTQHRVSIDTHFYRAVSTIWELV